MSGVSAVTSTAAVAPAAADMEKSRGVVAPSERRTPSYWAGVKSESSAFTVYTPGGRRLMA
jgi:hypothetical protein